MIQFIIEGPDQLPEAAECCAGVLPSFLQDWRPRRVLLGAMGGSALGGGVVRSLLYGHDTPGVFEINRDYIFEHPPQADTLVVLISYSGNTEETLSMFRRAVKSPARILGVAAGGRLEELFAAEKGCTERCAFIKIPPKPEGFQPRFSLYFTTAVLISVLEACGWLEPKVDWAALRTRLRARMALLEDQGKELASFIQGRIPVVYSGMRFEEGLSRVWKVKLNENVKIPAVAGGMPEVNHNEMISFNPSLAGRYAFLLLEELEAQPGMAARFELFEKVMQDRGYASRRIPMQGSSLLEGILDSLLLADWVCYHLAARLGVDPVSIPLIQDFKARITRDERG